VTRVLVHLDSVVRSDRDGVPGHGALHLVGTVTVGSPEGGRVARRPVVDADVPDRRVPEVTSAASDEDPVRDRAWYEEAVGELAAAVAGVLQALPTPCTAGAALVLPLPVEETGDDRALRPGRGEQHPASVGELVPWVPGRTYVVHCTAIEDPRRRCDGG
jgi:hypothetical protein